MFELQLQAAAVVRTLADGSLLAEALLFPEVSCLAAGPRPLNRMLARRVRELVRLAPPGSIYRRRLEELPRAASVRVEVPPLRDDVGRRTPVTLTIHYVEWRHGGEAVLAYVPALGIEVLAEGPRQLAEQLVPQIRSALARRKSADSLRELVLLDRVRRLSVRPLGVRVKLPTLKQAAQHQRDAWQRERSVLKETATDLTKAPARPIYERDELAASLARLLTVRTPRSVLLVGPSGVGKSALVGELARRRVELQLGETPLWSTGGSRLIAGMSGFGMWQERCRKLVREAAKTRAVVHLGNLVELMEVGKGGGNAQGIAAVLRPSIASSTLLAIAECTPEQLALVEREDPQLLEAFLTLEVAEPSAEQTRGILASVAADAVRRGLPAIAAEALDELLRLHRRHATYSASPGRPLRFLRNLLEDYSRAEGAGRSRAAEPISTAGVTAAFSHETGLPRFMLDDAVPLELAAVRAWFTERVVGQPEPVDVVVDLLASIKAGLARGGKPLASLLFIGPTGVGKTEMAKSLAEFLYRDPGRMIRFDMSEYGTLSAVERLIGGAYAKEGLLTQRVRDQPFMVVLLDEFEKAHPALFDVLLQVLGEGRLTDAAGRMADFSNAVVIATSNLGTESFRRGLRGFSGETRTVEAAQHFEREVRQFLRPEMFNRLDRIVPFAALDRETITAIARREIARVTARDGLRLRGIALNVDDAVLDRLAEVGYDPRYGARPLKRAIERHITALLAADLCQLKADAGASARARLEGNEIRTETTISPAGAVAAARSHERALGQLSKLVGLRRKAQALARSGVVLRLRNDIYRLRQAERQRHRRLKRLGKPPRFQFTPEQGRLLSQEELLAQVDELLADVCRLEDAALGDWYANRSLDADDLGKRRKPLVSLLGDYLFRFYALQSGATSTLAVVVFGPEIGRVLELAAAYEHIASKFGTSIQRYWLKRYDPALDRPPRNGASAKSEIAHPSLRLLGRKRQEDDPDVKTLDAYSADEESFHAPPVRTIGVGLVVQDARAAALLESEAGKHEFARRGGNPLELHVETHPGLLIGYSPPPDVGRASAFTNAKRRRRYDLQTGECRDDLLDATLEIRGRSIDAVVAAAAERWLTLRTWKLLD